MKILAVDNHHLMLKFYTRMLEKYGHEFLTAENGLDALKLLKSFIPDVILLDMIMPNIDGKKLTSIIRRTPHLKDVKIIFVSAVAAEEQLDLDKHGANGCIAKGTFATMESNIMDMLNRLENGSSLEPHEKIKGLDNLFQREITKELIYSKRHFEIILNDMSEGIMELSENNNVVYANPSAVSLTGVSEESLLGSNLADHFVGANQKKISSLLKKTTDQKESYSEESHLEINEQSFYLKIIPVSEEGKNTKIAILNDVTNTKKVIESLQYVMKMESIGTLAGGIAHDFNNLMMGIMGNVSVLLLDVNYTHPHYEILKKIEGIVKSASHLTEQLLGYAGKGKHEPKIINLNDLVIDSSEIFGRTNKDIVIKRHLMEDLLPVEVDRVQIEQVLLNLYVNSIQAMPDGGELIIETSNTSHTENKNKQYEPKEGKYVLLKVTDTGIGMEDNDQHRIFDPFFTTKEIGRGTGLGLASAYGIIKNHNGYIEAESEGGKGTTFKILLPAVEKRIPVVEKKKEVKLEKEVVLLVDDEEVTLDSGNKMLRILDYDVITAPDGMTAIEIFESRKEEIDLTIIDMVMPGMSGDKVYTRLREMQPDVKVLISSGYSINDLPEGFSLHDRERFIQKPFDLKTLYKKTREILDKL